MVKQAAKLFLIFIASAVLFSCAGKELELEIKAFLDGKPAAGAGVVVDEVEVGATDEEGRLSVIIKRKPDTEVRVSVFKEAGGYKIEPWESSFVVKAPEKGVVDKYPLEVKFKATKYITIAVTEKGVPVEGASISINGKKVTDTDATGEFVYEYTSVPKNGLKIAVSKKGYGTWRKTAKVTPGGTVKMAVLKQAVFTFRTLTEEYGRTKRIADVVVYMDNKKIGKTNSKGYLKYIRRSRPGKKVSIELSAHGYVPSEWKTSIALEGEHAFKRYFYNASPKPVRAGIYGYAANVPGEDLSDIIERVEEAVGNNLFSYLVFRKVPVKTLKKKIRQAKLDIEKMTTGGWEKTSLSGSVDVVILGSIGRNKKGFIIETKAYASDGRLVLSQINTAKRKRDIKGVAKKIVKNIIEQFPFEGMVTGKKDDRYVINLGSSDYKLRRGMEFALMAASLDKNGRVIKHKNTGALRIKKTGKTASWADIVEIKKGEKAKAGDRVVRYTFGEQEKKAAKDSFTLVAKGGVSPDVQPLGGVNVYINDRWTGVTGPDGKAVIPVRLGKTYDIVLYRHGYQQMVDKVRAGTSKEVKEFVLNVNSSVFMVDTDPVKATVYVDEVEIGKTPIMKGKKLNFGFHTVRLSAGGDYRDWEEVMEFNAREVDRTGEKSITIHLDYVRMGDGERKKGNFDDAISIYSRTEKEHPDYADARFSLAQLYMDEKNDYNAAIREFENVLSLPENEQLIYKQYAVTYTNLGHAYYENGNEIILSDKKTAARNFAEAVANLEKAKQNLRFLPTEHYEEAAHDTYYYLAVSYHKLYLVTRKNVLLDKADFAWREYFDFFPQKLEGDSVFAEMRDSAEKYWTQIKDLK